MADSILITFIILDGLILHAHPWPWGITRQGLGTFLVVTILERNVHGISWAGAGLSTVASVSPTHFHPHVFSCRKNSSVVRCKTKFGGRRNAIQAGFVTYFLL